MASKKILRKRVRQWGSEVKERAHYWGKKAKEGLASKKGSKREGKRLCRSGKDKILGGVCSGIAEYYGWDPTLVRLGWIVLSVLWGAGILLYIILWIIMPRNPNWK